MKQSGQEYVTQRDYYMMQVARTLVFEPSLAIEWLIRARALALEHRQHDDAVGALLIMGRAARGAQKHGLALRCFSRAVREWSWSPLPWGALAQFEEVQAERFEHAGDLARSRRFAAKAVLHRLKERKCRENISAH